MAMEYHFSLNHAHLDTLKKISHAGAYSTLTPEVAAAYEGMTSLPFHHTKLRSAPHKPNTFEPRGAGKIISSDTLCLMRSSFLLLLDILAICPIQPTSAMGYRNILNFIDQSTRYAISMPISTWEKVQPSVLSTLQYIGQHNKQYPQLFHSDNAKEFLAKNVATFLSRTGISKSITWPHQPQQNAIAERWNLIILNSARASLHHSSLPESFRDLAVLGSI